MTAVIPVWAAPDDTDIRDAHWTAWQAYEANQLPVTAGIVAAIGWCVGVQAAPCTERDDAASAALVRAETWLALCYAAEMGEPTRRDWDLFGVKPLPAVTTDQEWSYGAWIALEWMLGDRAEPPIRLPNGPQDPVYIVPLKPGSDEWHEKRRRWVQQNRAEARQRWATIRRRLAEAS